MNVVVTGAAGHLGSHLVPKLQCAGFTVTGIDLAPAPPALAGRCRFLQLDLAAGDGSRRRWRAPRWSSTVPRSTPELTGRT